jgi:DNA-binding SARP family transcriptional activator
MSSRCRDANTGARVQLELRFLGQFAVRGVDGWQAGPPPKKGKELIQYLGAYPRRVATRDELAAAFWPELEPDTVTHRVHLAVSGARAYLKTILTGRDAIRCVARGYTWDASVEVHSDVELFLGQCNRSTTDAFRAAVDLYGGEFLAGETADWLQPMRVRCSSAYGSALEGIAQRAVAAGDYRTALTFGLQLVQLDRGHEGATRLVMRCFAATGQRGRALEQYRALHAYLAKHLSVEPTEETVTLARQLVYEPARTASVRTA